MKYSKAAFILALTAATIMTAALGDSHAQSRFGPFLHYAPYYFPKDGCKGFCFSAEDYRPMYEDPNPLPPPRGRMPVPKPRPSKVKPHLAQGPMMPFMHAPPQHVVAQPFMGAPPQHVVAQYSRPPLPPAQRISPRPAMQVSPQPGPRPVITTPVGPVQQ